MTAVVAASLAAAVATQDQPPALPLAITTTWIERAEGLPPGTGFPRVEVLNTGKRAILAWGIRWVLKRPDGRRVGSSGFSVDAASVPPEHRKMSIAPGQTSDSNFSGAVVPADSLFSDISLTFVIFDDDTALGDAEPDPKFREEPYYIEILARMSTGRMELSQMTPERVLTNIQTTISTQKANLDAHVNRR
jgi:hypothetical protein